MTDADGGHKHRLTIFNEPGSPEFAGAAVRTGPVSFAPDDSRFLGDIQTSLLSQVGTGKFVDLAGRVR